MVTQRKTSTASAGRLALLVLAVVTIVVTDPTPADATTCLRRPWPIEDHVESAEWVFTGHRTFRWFWQSRSSDSDLAPIRVEVVEAFKGEIPSVVEVWMDRRDVEHWGWELVSFAAIPDGDGNVIVGDCYGAIADATADELAAYFDENPAHGRIVPHAWRSPWAPIVVLLAIGSGIRRRYPENLDEALGLA